MPNARTEQIRARRRLLRALTPLACAGLLWSCDAADGDDHDTDGHDHGEETEIISRVELRFVPDGGGDPVVARFDDPDGDGGVSGTLDPITLTAGTAYTLEIGFENALETPAEDIGAEVAEEAEEHLVLIAGDSVNGPATGTNDAILDHAYADVESDYAVNAVGDDLPVGLVNDITAQSAGSGDFRVMLRHLPELNGVPQKTAGLPAAFAAGDPLPGDADVDLVFSVTVE